MDNISKAFQQLLEMKNVRLTSDQVHQFNVYYDNLVEWNHKINLTAITDREQVFIKHFYDSLSLAFYIDIPHAEKIIDIGSGAGFPGIPLKIAYPHLKLTIVDSLNKRIKYLKQLLTALNIHDVELWHGRAEDAARILNFREQFDIVTARAVAPLPILNEICLPFVKVGGKFAAFKSMNAGAEIQEASYSLQQLKAQVTDQHSFELPDEQGERSIIIVHKFEKTPSDYPRKAGIPNKFPLK